MELPVTDVILSNPETKFIYTNRVNVFVGMTADATNFVEVLFFMSKEYTYRSYLHVLRIIQNC